MAIQSEEYRQFWLKSAKCRKVSDPDFFFPDSEREADKNKKFCAGCPVSTDCLDYALTNRIEHGIWGGMSERDRRRVLRVNRVAIALVGEGGLEDSLKVVPEVVQDQPDQTQVPEHQDAEVVVLHKGDESTRSAQEMPVTQ